MPCHVCLCLSFSFFSANTYVTHNNTPSKKYTAKCNAKVVLNVVKVCYAIGLHYAYMREWEAVYIYECRRFHENAERKRKSFMLHCRRSVKCARVCCRHTPYNVPRAAHARASRVAIRTNGNVRAKRTSSKRRRMQSSYACPRTKSKSAAYGMQKQGALTTL